MVDLTDTESSSDDAMNSSNLNQHEKANSDASAESAPRDTSSGGEFGFVKVSRIASIEVKETPSNTEFYPNAARPTTSTRLESLSSPAKSKQKRQQSKKDKAKKQKLMVRELAGDDTTSEEEIRPENDPMDVIRVSPYEGNSNAEREVKLFEDLKHLLAEGNKKTETIFGAVNAPLLVKSYAEIDQSGMVYSQEWVDGILRGSNVGILPKDLLLLCLISSRLAKVDEFLMAGLTRDLEVFKIVKEALKEWDLEDEYKRIAGTSDSLKNFTFNGKRRQCFKCEIFVARAYSCYKAFGCKGDLEKSLLSKVRTCLDIMESRLPVPKRKDSKKRKKSIENPPPAEPMPVVSAPIVDVAPPTKRKRGRPPKNRQLSPPNEVPPDIFADDLDSPEMVPRRGSSARPAPRMAANKNEESLTFLVSKFEKQYKEMGKQYEAMGKTLSLLKGKLGEDRKQREHELHNELLVGSAE
eukprot:scaffold2076_cov106-Cylindrotheca_fusiformis.AAC.4